MANKRKELSQGSKGILSPPVGVKGGVVFTKSGEVKARPMPYSKPNLKSKT